MICQILSLFGVIHSRVFNFFFQDFELWDDVGLNIPKPPDLLQLYRNCGTPLPSPRDTVDVSVGVDFGDLPGNCNAQDPPKKPDLSQQVCVYATASCIPSAKCGLYRLFEVEVSQRRTVGMFCDAAGDKKKSQLPPPRSHSVSKRPLR